MKFFIVFAALFAVALAAPVEHNEDTILKQGQDVNPEGYNYFADTSDGTHREESGQLKDIGTEHEALVVHGEYSWEDPKTGEHFVVKYVADENGYQPEGAHLPKA